MLEPRLEGLFRPAPHRHLGFAEYGDVHGRVVFWFHGTPGGRRQIAPQAHENARRMGIRLIIVERPGVGFSTPHRYRNVLGFADDIGLIADGMGIDHFACVGLSGGGPYTLACAARFPDRMVAGAVLGGVAPTVGPDAIGGGVVGFAHRFAPLISVAHKPLGFGLHRFVRTLTPLRSPAFNLYVAISPEGDKRLFQRPEMKDMFVNDIVRSMRHQAHAPVLDLILFSRDWGFRLGDLRMPIRFWHGDADNIVPLDHVRHMVSLVPDHSELHVRHGESHLGTLDASEEIFQTLLDLWDEREPALVMPDSLQPA